MASRKSSRATGGSPSPGSKRGERRRSYESEAVALRGRGGGSSGGRSRGKGRGRCCPSLRCGAAARQRAGMLRLLPASAPFPPPAPLVPPALRGLGRGTQG